MPKVFALFTAGALASLALPGMSGFAGEIAVFMGMATSDIYSSTFRVVTIFLSALGLILTPIYLLSMLRQIFYNPGGMAPNCDIAPSCDITDPDLLGRGNQEAVCFGNSCVMPAQAEFSDARPREILIAACFLVPIIIFGCYPKLAMQMYDAKTVAVNVQLRQSHAQAYASNPTYSQQFSAPPLLGSKIAAVSSILKWFGLLNDRR